LLLIIDVIKSLISMTFLLSTMIYYGFEWQILVTFLLSSGCMVLA